jgi:imidazolonepropionase-like amidohydrolase
MPSWHVRGVFLPDGVDVQERWLSRDGWHDKPVGEGQSLPGRFALPGLVDAHSHVSFAIGSHGPVPVDQVGAEVHRARWATEGVAIVRDAGGNPDVVLNLPTVAGRPIVVAAGRHLAPRGFYFEAVHLPADPDDVVDIALAELAMGASWVKLVADFAPSRAQGGPALAAPEQTYGLGLVERLVTAAHAAGGRVAAHVTTPLVGDLVGLGLDSVEHGTALDEETVAEMARRHIAWTPTLCAAFGSGATRDDETARVVAERRARLSQLLPSAVRQGVPVLTGSDVVGSIPREIALLAACGLDPVDALRAATTTATGFLAADLCDVPSSVVTYENDPRNDPGVLATPAAIIIGGARVR